VRTITCLPAITGDWRLPGAGALLSTSKQYPFDSQALERPDLIRPGTRTINMTQLAGALNGEMPGPPVKAMFVYNSNPATVCPDQSRVIAGLKREDLFTVVHEQFLTDTARYADIVLPATTQLEHFDIHNSYGHLDVQVNAASIAPLAEAKCNTDVFRLLAKTMNFESEIFEISDEDLAREWLGTKTKITLERLLDEGPIRLNLPKDWAPYAAGNFGTPSGKCHLYSPSEAGAGRDPLPFYQPPHEDPQTRPDLATKYPLQLLSPPSPTFLNSTFVNVDHLRKEAKTVTVELHPRDAATRNIIEGDAVTVFNSRGRFRATAAISENIRPGVAITFGCWWAKYTEGGANCNSTTSTALTDFGDGATFFDNMVQVAKLAVSEESP
jgi:anaerobic selenocysteine-containing dehydrogenase